MLKDEIDTAKRSVVTDTVSITIGEIANMYAERELNIIPEFQRLFRWTAERKSNFVESILIGIPIPPAFAYENENGTWELIDGLQRISTVLEFMGVLRDADSGEMRKSTLVETKYLPSLAGVSWHAETSEESTLDKALQLFFRRHRIDFQILKHPSNPKTKFDLFQRLNRGGAYANEQEVRTCSMVLANAIATRNLRSFAASTAFQAIFRINEEQKANQTDLEYAVRMIVHTYTDFQRGKDVQEFLDQAIIDLISVENIDLLIQPCIWSIETLYRLRGAEALLPPPGGTSYSQRFSLRALEGVAVGLAKNKDKISALSDPDSFINERIDQFWIQKSVADMSASGLRGTVRLQKTVPFGTLWFDPDA